MSDNKFQFTGNTYSDVETARPSLTYWQDAWRRLKKNKLSMAGLIVIFLILLFGIVGPMFSPYSYSEQINKYKNLPPSLSLYKLGDIYLYSSNDYNLFLVEGNGRVIDKIELDRSRRDIPNKIYTYVLNGEDIKLNFSYKMLPAAQRLDYDFTLEYRGEIATQPDRTRPNILFPFGTDDLGRDLLTRVMYGARISLLVAFIATVVNLFIGVIYGSISGYEGGRVDDIMMRIVDIINSVPLTLYVILLMVWFRGGGLINIIIALSSVFWVNEARLVRGQVLSL